MGNQGIGGGGGVIEGRKAVYFSKESLGIILVVFGLQLVGNCLFCVDLLVHAQCSMYTMERGKGWCISMDGL